MNPQAVRLLLAAVALAAPFLVAGARGDKAVESTQPLTAVLMRRPLSEAPSLLQRRTDFQSGQLQRQEADRPLRVLCWNVMYTNFGTGKESLRDRLASIMVDDMQADVAGLQECMNLFELQTALGARMTGAPDTDMFNCIYYKQAVVQFQGISGRRYLGDDAKDSYSRRFVSYAKLAYQGNTFWLLSTHWCLDNECGGDKARPRHKRSAEVILELRRELGADMFPTIITADCNSHMDGFDNDDGVRHFVDNGFNIAGKGPMAGGIDYIFVTAGDWTSNNHKVGPTWPSDHPSFFVELTFTAAGIIRGTAPSPSPTPATISLPMPAPAPVPGQNFYRQVSGVGGWGGWCTCPDGQRYNVGDRNDGCINGPSSLACEGGAPAECNKVDEFTRTGMMVTCAPASGTPVMVPTPAPLPVLTPAPMPATVQVANDYRRVAGVGGWGGWCTCPNGQRYNVGDKMDACGNGPSSLACEGGVPGECVKTVDADRDGMMVTCAPVLSVHPDLCAHYDSWPALESTSARCGQCRASVLTQLYGGRCDRYCASFGQVCIAAAEVVNKDCNESKSARCDEEIKGESDMLCTCHFPTSVTA